MYTAREAFLPAVQENLRNIDSNISVVVVELSSINGKLLRRYKMDIRKARMDNWMY